MSVIKDAFQDMYDLLEEEENWCRGSFARDETGATTAVTNSSANCWCMLGAAIRTIERRGLNKDQQKDMRTWMNASVHHVLGESRSVVYLNDVVGHAKVVEALAWLAEKVK